MAKTIFLSGEISYARFFSPDEKYGKYSVTIKLDEESIPVFKEAKLQSRDKGDNTYTFRRDPEKMIKGELVQFGPPPVINADGSAFDSRIRIGNGTKATLKLSVYTTPKGTGSRLEKVRIDELVEYNPGDGPF